MHGPLGIAHFDLDELTSCDGTAPSASHALTMTSSALCVPTLPLSGPAEIRGTCPLQYLADNVGM